MLCFNFYRDCFLIKISIFVAKLTNRTMKKIIIALVAVAFFASCKKDYTCTCTESVTNTVTNSPLGKVKKADAETACNRTLLTTTCVAKES